MNRKEFIKSIVGLGVIGATAPVLAKEQLTGGIQGVPTGRAPTPMPPDTRTNDEVWDDHMNEGVRTVENSIKWDQQNFKYVHAIDSKGYDRVKKLIAEKGWAFTEKVRDGITTFEVEGLLFRLY